MLYKVSPICYTPDRQVRLPVRHDRAAEYRGEARVVYGHTLAPEAVWLNRKQIGV